MQVTWKGLGTRMFKVPIRDHVPQPQASLLIIWWCMWHCGIHALQPVDALRVFHPSHDAPHSLFACSKPAPGHKTEEPLWPLIHTSSHKKPCFLLDVQLNQKFYPFPTSIAQFCGAPLPKLCEVCESHVVS